MRLEALILLSTENCVLNLIHFGEQNFELRCVLDRLCVSGALGAVVISSDFIK